MSIEIKPLQAIALVDDEHEISLSHLFPESARAEWEAEIEALTAKLAQKGATHSIRIVSVTIALSEGPRS